MCSTGDGDRGGVQGGGWGVALSHKRWRPVDVILADNAEVYLDEAGPAKDHLFGCAGDSRGLFRM